MRSKIADLTRLLHVGVIVTAVFGWLISDPVWLRSYIALLTLILVQWLINNDQCVMTDWETRLRHGFSAKDKEPENTFIGQMFHRLSGRYPTYKQINAVSYASIILFMMIAFGRLYFEI
jgi:hypothetical protein